MGGGKGTKFNGPAAECSPLPTPSINLPSTHQVLGCSTFTGGGGLKRVRGGAARSPPHCVSPPRAPARLLLDVGAQIVTALSLLCFRLHRCQCLLSGGAGGALGHHGHPVPRTMMGFLHSGL